MSAKTLFVGIDVSSTSLDVCFMDQGGKRISSIHTYPNLPEGFKLLRQDALVFSRLLGKRTPIVFGFESTGNWHRNLEKFLRARKSKRFTIRIINPYRIKEFRKSHFKLSKTDKIDSFMIAKFLIAFPEPSSPYLSPQQLSLRSLTRFRRTLIEERTRYINRLRKSKGLFTQDTRKLLEKNSQLASFLLSPLILFLKMLKILTFLLLLENSSPSFLSFRIKNPFLSSETKLNGLQKELSPSRNRLKVLNMRLPESWIPITLIISSFLSQELAK